MQTRPKDRKKKDSMQAHISKVCLRYIFIVDGFVQGIGLV